MEEDKFMSRGRWPKLLLGFLSHSDWRVLHGVSVQGHQPHRFQAEKKLYCRVMADTLELSAALAVFVIGEKEN
jgi:hypothetical protein